MNKYKKIIEQMKGQSSEILVNLCFLDLKLCDKENLEEIAIAIDNLYENYEELLKIYKKLKD